MKTKIQIVLLILVVFFSMFCSNNNKKIQKNESKYISWMTEISSKSFILVHPIDFDERAVDAYSLPIKHKLMQQWYLLNRDKLYIILPVNIGYFPNFIDRIKERGISQIDTIYTEESGLNRFESMNGINSMEIVCFKDGFSVYPEIWPNGMMSLSLKESK